MRIPLAALAAAYAVWLGCPPPAIPPPPGVLTGCFDVNGVVPITIKSTGSTSFSPIAGSITNTTGTAVTWAPSASTGTLIDNGSASGTVTNPPAASGTRTLNANGTYATSVGTSTLTVGGNITGPPPPCTGSGTWRIDQNVRGTWSIP